MPWSASVNPAELKDIMEIAVISISSGLLASRRTGCDE
jgi:hypothetical protein